MLALILTALILPAAHTWTVDDDGPADFTQIADAIAAASAGDVLLVEPGTYAGFELIKRVTILGKAGGAHPRVTDLTRVLAESFTLAGLDFDGLRLEQVASRGRIDDCRVGYTGDLEQQYAFEVDACAQIVVSRTFVKGSKPYSQVHYDTGGSGMIIRSSNATLVNCAIEGAKGLTPTTFGFSGGDGGTALTVTEDSYAFIVGSLITGGEQGWSTESIFSCHDGDSGTGLEVVGATVIARGGDPSFGASIKPGKAVFSECGGTEGWAIFVSSGTLVISGVFYDIDNVIYPASTVIQPDEPEPFLSLQGIDAPGGHVEIRVHGPPHEPCLLAVSPAPDYAPLGQYTEKLWVSLSGAYLLFPLLTKGQSQPVLLTWQVPASAVGLAGLTVELQPFFPHLRSEVDLTKAVAGNVAELIVRF